MDMNDNEILKKTEQVLISVIGNNRMLTPSTKLTELGMDSLKTVELIVKLEGAFNISIEDNDLIIENFSTLNEITDLLKKTLKGINVS